MAGAAGFEPANADSKNRCLTAWRRPNIIYNKELLNNNSLCFNTFSLFLNTKISNNINIIKDKKNKLDELMFNYLYLSVLKFKKLKSIDNTQTLIKHGNTRLIYLINYIFYEIILTEASLLPSFSQIIIK